MVRQITDQDTWDAKIRANEGHPLQLWGWGEVKAKHRWHAYRLEVSDKPWAGAQVLIRALPWPFRCIAYIPRGPVGKWTDESYDQLAQYIHKTFHAVMVSVEPDCEKVNFSREWRASEQTILLPKTVMLDLQQSEEELLAGMSKKTRQYIRKSEKDGVTVRKATSEDDIATCLAIYKDTAIRAHFALHDDSYYRDVRSLMGEHSPIYIAVYEGAIVSFLWCATSNATSFELYGGVNGAGQQVRANYFLKWFAIRDLKNHGVKNYDLNGLLNDGVSSFKLGFSNGTETMLAGTYDRPLSPLYSVWKTLLPTTKRVIRQLSRR